MFTFNICRHCMFQYEHFETLQICSVTNLTHCEKKYKKTKEYIHFYILPNQHVHNFKCTNLKITVRLYVYKISVSS